MKKLSRKLLISIFTLVITVLAVGASTFAWFALSTTSQVSNIGGKVTGGEGIEVRLYHKLESTDPEVEDKITVTPWKSNLSDNDVSTFLKTIKETNFEFKAVNSLDGANFTMLALSAGILKLGETAKANEDYLEFQIQFRSQSNGTIALTKYEFDATKNPLKDVIIDSNDYLQYNLANTNNDLSAHPVSTKAAFGARLSLNNGTDTQVYQHAETDPKGLTNNSNIIVGNYVMGTKPVEVGQWSYLTTGLGLIIHDSTGSSIDLPTSDLLAEAYTSHLDEDDHRSTVTLLENPTSTGDANKNHFAEFAVRLWIEGWDADTYDVILTMPLYISLEFKKIA